MAQDAVFEVQRDIGLNYSADYIYESLIGDNDSYIDIANRAHKTILFWEIEKPG